MSHRINSFPIEQGRVNLETPSTVTGEAVLCVTDGVIAVIFNDDSTADIAMVAGDSIDFRNAKLATISSGKFHGQ